MGLGEHRQIYKTPRWSGRSTEAKYSGEQTPRPLRPLKVLVHEQFVPDGSGGPLEPHAVGLIRLNPFTAPACTISGLKDAGTRLQTVYFPVL